VIARLGRTAKGVKADQPAAKGERRHPGSGMPQAVAAAKWM
jgi:hypothetical protein